ncbi:MAG: sulfate permease [Thermostichales cyanobacterium BF4_bins_65]
MIQRLLPAWLRSYRREHLAGDVIAGLVSGIMLVPQSMAYAQLAGLPAQVGLYASIVPLATYALLGSSPVLSVGPVAIVALMVLAGLEPLAAPNSPEFVHLTLGLSLLIGIIQALMGLLRLGFVVHFLSHAVISAFTSASALIIGFGQMKHLLGVKIPTSESFPRLLADLWNSLDQVNFLTLAIGLLAITILLYGQMGLGSHLTRLGIPKPWILPVTKAAPLAAILVTTLVVSLLGWSDRVAVVGVVPQGLPPLTLDVIRDQPWGSLMPPAIAISLVGFTESYAMGQSLASKRRQKVDPDQDLVGLGAANVAAALTGGMPVTGGISRSVVNFQAGANTGLASLITAALLALTVLVLTPLFTDLPQTTLAATVMVAVFKLADFRPLQHSWHYDPAEAGVWLLTFAGVLLVGVEPGIALGALGGIGVYLWRTSRPHLAIVGQVPGTEHYRNIQRHQVLTNDQVLLVRVDESLYFANAAYLETRLLSWVAERPQVQHLVLICSAVNAIDGSALESLLDLISKLRDAGVTLHLAEVKGPVMDRLSKIGIEKKLHPGQIFLSTHQAATTLAGHQQASLPL